MRVLNFVARSLTCVAVLAMATVANAQFVEMGDAGDFTGGSGFQGDATGTAFTQILGDNGGAGDLDAYLITVTDAANLFIEDVGANDTKAFLFDTSGNALFANDDDPTNGGGDFTFGFSNPSNHAGNVIGTPADLADGDQFILVVGAFGDTALDNGGASLFLADGGDFSAITGPDAASTGVLDSFAGGGAGAYDIRLTGAEIRVAVPEPATAGLIAIGLVGVVLRRRK